MFPSRFYDPSNLRSACRNCNLSGAPRIAAENAANARLVVDLQRIIVDQQDQLEALTAEFARYQDGERGEPERQSTTPRISEPRKDAYDRYCVPPARTQGRCRSVRVSSVISAQLRR